MITSAILEILDQELMYMHIIPATLFGMVKDVGPSAPAVSSITRHGFRKHYHRLPVMTSNCTYAMAIDSEDAIIFLLEIYVR